VPGGCSRGGGAAPVIRARSVPLFRFGTGRRIGLASTGAGTVRANGSSSQARMDPAAAFTGGTASRGATFFLGFAAFFAGLVDVFFALFLASAMMEPPEILVGRGCGRAVIDQKRT
jgi:hypothetical protein